MELFKTIHRDFTIRIGNTFGPLVIGLNKVDFDWSIAQLRLKVFSDASCSSVNIDEQLALTTTDPGRAEAILEIAAAETALFEPHHYKYELELSHDDVVRTILSGKMKATDKYDSRYDQALELNFVDGVSIEVKFLETGIGKSNYQLWLDQDNTGSFEDYQNTLKQPLDPTILQKIEDNESALQELQNLTVEAAEDIVSYKSIAVIDDKAYIYDASNLDHLYAFMGFSLTGVVAGEQLVIQKIGIVEFAGWNLIPGRKYLAGANGQLVLSVTNEKFKNTIAYAIASDKINIITENDSLLINN